MTPTAVMTSLAVTLLFLVLGLVSLDQGRVQERTVTRRARPELRGRRRPAWRRHTQAVVLRLPLGRSVQERLVRAGLGHHAGDVVLVVAVVALVVHQLALLVVVWPAAALLALVTVLAAERYLDRLVRRRAERFAEQLADIARVMSSAAGAGMALPNALALTAREMEEPARSLLGQAVRRMGVGESFAGAMAELTDRVPSRELTVLVSTLVIQQRTGGDVIEALREMSTNLEARRDLRREVDTVMAGVRFTAYAVMGLGAATLVVLESISPGTLRRLTERPAGQLVLLLSLAFFAAGALATRRLSRIDL